MKFRQLGLIDPILNALGQAGYSKPTPIQEKAIPPALAGRDVLGCAQTGTGKTCAFATPILQRLNENQVKPKVIRALILTPTRELALQIQDSFVTYGRGLSLRSAVIFGGVGQQPQVEAIRRGLDILVATPGRLLDLQGQGLLDLSHIEIFVLDEADRMLDMGFIHDVKRVLKLLPQQKQTLFFSATMPPEVMALVNGLLHDYVKVEVNPVSSPVEVIEQSLYYVDKANKTKLLAHLIETLHIPSALVFSRTKHGANRIAQDLEKTGISAAAIHGNKSQTARVQALNDFKAGRVQVLVATDIAARGIDIEELPYVFNYNLPDVPETYIHRIGRTGRAGHEGKAISFCQFDEQDDLKSIHKLLGRTIPVVEGHPFPMEVLEAPPKDKRGRTINAEDAEARAAAKERRRQRDAENKARAEQRKKAAAEQVLEQSKAPKEAVPSVPAKPKKKKKKKAVLVPTPVVEEKPVAEKKPAAEKAPDKSGEQRPLNRGVRHGRLLDTMPSDPSMPQTDFVKPNPLDSDVIMDATARLLAPRKPVVVGRAEPVKTEPKQPRPQQQTGKKTQEGKKPAVKQKQQPPKEVPKQQEAKKPEPKHEQTAHKKNRRRSDRPRPIEAAPRSDRQKDSTQHKSLMKPYYISHED